jgi:hypothetical protein
MSRNAFLDVTPRPRPSQFDLNALKVGGNIGLATRALRLGIANMRSGGIGVDIVCIGTSLTRGFNDPNNWTTGWVHRLKVALQNQFNPAGVLGGYGYMRAWDTVGGIRNDASFMTTSGAGISNSTGGTNVTRVRLAQNATARTNRVIYQFNGLAADAVASRRDVTSVDLLVFGAAGSTTADGRVDWQTASAPGLSAGTGGSFSLDTQTTPLTSQYPDARVRYVVTSGDNLFFQIGNGTTTPGALNDFWTAGLIAYRGDENTGVRVHNIGFPGGQSTNFNTGDELTGNFTRFCTGAANGATNAKLYIIELGYNDYRSAAVLATTQSAINTLLNTLQASPSSPGVIFLIPPMAADGAAAWAGANGLAMQLNAWLYSLAATRQEVAVVDLLGELGGGYNYTSAGANGYLTALQPRGFNESDLIHWSASMQSYVATGMYNTIMSGLQN